MSSRIAETMRDATRYRRLRVLGCIVFQDAGGVRRFMNLDQAIDADLAACSTRGEATDKVPPPGKVDRKFEIFAFNPVNGKAYDENNSLLLCAKDAAVPATLATYRNECIRLGTNREHIESVDYLIDRVVQFQLERGGGRVADTIGSEIPRCLYGLPAGESPDDAEAPKIWCSYVEGQPSEVDCARCEEVGCKVRLPMPGASPAVDGPKDERQQVCYELARVINRFSLESDSDTPDFILAEYLVRCLENFNGTVVQRGDWYAEAAEAKTAIPKPPLGAEPNKFWRERVRQERIEELQRAIHGHLESGRLTSVLGEWITELAQLAEQR